MRHREKLLTQVYTGGNESQDLNRHFDSVFVFSATTLQQPANKPYDQHNLVMPITNIIPLSKTTFSNTSY